MSTSAAAAADKTPAEMQKNCANNYNTAVKHKWHINYHHYYVKASHV